MTDHQPPTTLAGSVSSVPGPPELWEPSNGSATRPGRQKALDRRYWAALIGITAVALGIRLAYVLVVTRYENSKIYDALWYVVESYGLAHGSFFETPFSTVPTAGHPPLTSIAITPATYFWGFQPGVLPQRVTMVLIGTATVLLVGLLARSIAGTRVALIAAALAAVYPNLWIPNGIIMSESLSMLLMVCILLGVYRLFRRPSWGNAALVGLACGLEILVRAELLLLIPFLLVPAALCCRRVRMWTRLGLMGIGIAVALLVIAPWVGRNLATFQDTTYLSTGTGPVLLGANCPQAYADPYIGLWSLQCSVAVKPARDPSVLSARQQKAGIAYMRHHAGRVPLVVAARVARLWSLYAPIQAANLDVNEGRPVPASEAGLAMYYLLLPAGVAGIIVLRRRRLAQWPLLVPAGVITVLMVASYGQIRFRAPFEVCLVVLAAAGIDGLIARMTYLHRRRRSGRAASRGLPPGPVAEPTGRRSALLDG